MQRKSFNYQNFGSWASEVCEEIKEIPENKAQDLLGKLVEKAGLTPQQMKDIDERTNQIIEIRSNPHYIICKSNNPTIFEVLRLRLFEFAKYSEKCFKTFNSLIENYN